MSGFTYNGVHCSELGCTYIPDASGNWFVSPDIEIGKDEVPGRDGNYYYNTKRKARTFTLNCFLEDVDIHGRERIRRWLDEKGSGWLIFDDRDCVKYFVRPSKAAPGKLYRDTTWCSPDELYSGTFTITFEAKEPVGYLTRLTDDNLLDTEADHICNLVRADMMPAAPTASSRQFLIYNQGTQPCSAIIRIAGTAPDGLDIYNETNGSMCRLRGLPESGTLVIDGKNGLVTTETNLGTEITYAYHDHGYIVLEPNNEINYTVYLETTAGSTTATAIPEMTEDLTGMYVWLDGAWNKITAVGEDHQVTLATAAQTTMADQVHLGKLNDIRINGTNLNLTTLEISYEPRAI